MKRCISGVLILLFLFLPSCGASKKIQSQVPYLGVDEITPMFVGRNTIADWIKDIKLNDVRYNFYIEGATGYTCLNIWTESFWLASFYVEDNSYASDYEHGEYKILPEEIKALDVIKVIYLDFEYMGVPYEIRGITKGSDADDVKLAFLDMKRDKVIDDEGLFTQELYNTKDVDPNAQEDDHSHSSMPYIGGIISETDDPEYSHNCIQSISYYYTLPQGNQYTIYNLRSEICFYIDDNQKVAALSYSDLTHRD